MGALSMRIGRLPFVAFALMAALALGLLAAPSAAFGISHYCMFCDKTTQGTTTYDYYGVAHAPTCTSEGLAAFVCSECGQANRPDIVVPALGHNYQFTRNTATCTAGGENIYTCSRCGATTSEHTGALGHSYSLSSSVAPTCTAGGSNTYKCSRCGTSYTEQVAALGHTYVKTTTKEPTCTEAGVNTFKCARCGDSYTEEVKALGHSYKHTTTEPTCTEEGAEIDTCERCGDVKSVPIPALGHDFDTPAVVPATCTKAGSSTATCKRCGTVETTALAALGHDWPKEWTVEKKPTLFEEGQEARVCTRCGEREVRPIAKLKLMETPLGPGLIIAGIAALAGVAAYVVRKHMAASAIAAAVAAAAAAAGGLELIKLTEKKIFAKLSDAPENQEFLDLVRSRPNLALTIFDPDAGTTLAEQVEEADPDAVVFDFSDDESLDALLESAAEVRGEDGEVKCEAIAHTHDEALAARLAEKRADGTLFATANAQANKYVKMSQLVVPLYKDFMKDADTLESIGTIADLFGIPAVSALLGAVANADRVGELKETAKDAFTGVDMELSDGVSVVGNIAELVGLDAVAAMAELAEDAADTRQSMASTDDGASHKTYKAGEVAKDLGDAIGSILG